MRCERASSTTMRAGAAGAAPDAALAGGGDDEAARVEGGVEPLGVPAFCALAVGAEGAADDAAGFDVDVVTCVDPEVQAVAKMASPTRAAARKQRRDDIST